MTGLFLALLLQAQPDPPDLWVYQATNLQVDARADEAEALWRRAAKAGYRKVLLADSKFSRLGDLGSMEGRYMRNVARLRKVADELGLEIVPAVFPVGYSNSILWHDPNLAAGLPVRDAKFVVKGGRARIVADPPVALRKVAFKDDVVKVEGGVATVRDNPGNARFVYKVQVAPFRAYHVSVKVRTEDYTGKPEVKALADRSLTYSDLGVAHTQDWKEHHVVFNSLGNEKVNVYFGVWGAGKGTLQWKDWRIEEAGLVNVLRRPGAPCTVKGYVEGKDYERIEDPKTGRVPYPGEYEIWHEPPAIRTGLPDGTELRVSWYHPAVIHWGQVASCISEPGFTKLLEDQAKRMRAAWEAKGYMMSHDEIRTYGWDEACLKDGLDAGPILARNARTCADLLKGSEVYVWSDMFDPHHNAHKDYYLVRGDLSGSWEGLPREVVIVNWNSGKAAKSLKFFADRGHRQVIAGYYDAPVERIRGWLEAARGVPGIVGIMYTTWHGNYRDLEAFAKAAR